MNNSKTLKLKGAAIFKIALTVILLLSVANLIEFNTLKSLIYKADIGSFLLALVFHFIAFYIMSIRWWLILAAVGKRLDYRSIFGVYYFGLFCNNFLPTSMGGDVVRIATLRAKGLNTAALIFATVTDRTVGLVSILLMGVIGLNFSTSLHVVLDNHTIALINILSLTILSLGALTLNTYIREKLIGFAEKQLKSFTRINNMFVYCHESLISLKNSTALYKAVLMSIVSQICIVVTYYLIGRSLGIEISFLEFALIVPVIFLVASLPISIGGLGVREGMLVILLNSIGVSTSNAVSLSFLYLSILIIATLPGALFLLTNKWKSREYFANS